MATSIPSASGVPGISGPPNWLGGAGSDVRLDDVRWRGAIKRSFGSGASGGDFFRATQAMEGADQFVYLTFRAGFAQELDTAHDFVWLGFMKSGGSTAIVLKLQVHPAGFDPKGPPSANPPANVQSIQVFSLSGGVWNLEGVNPSWINTNTRYWLQSATDVPADPNSRWAVQIKIKAKNAGTLLDNDGVNIGTGFQMWYLMRGSVGGNPTILAEYRVDGGATTPLNLNSNVYPEPPGRWDLFNLTAGAATSGGVALYGSDVLVSNAAYGEGTTIDNGQPNTFIARPRNYSSALVPAANINATFRIANWGSVGGDPNQINFSDSEWAYVPGNSEVVPVQGAIDIPTIVAPANPPANSPIALAVPNMTLPPNKSKHQCVLCTLSGTNVNFLNDAVYRNMNYDTASTLTREATISCHALSGPRDVYLAVEKVNLAKTLPPGTDEGKFMEASFKRAMEKGGELAEKLKNAQSKLDDIGDPSVERLEGILKALVSSLLSVNESGSKQLDQLASFARPWLLEVAPLEQASKRLAKVFDKIADWLEASANNSEAALGALSNELNVWLSNLGNDPSTLHTGPQVLQALSDYNILVFGGKDFSNALQNLGRWLQSNRSPTELPVVVRELIAALRPFSNGNEKIKAPVAVFSRDVARWLSGSSRLEVLVDVLAEVGLTEEELDQLFPTYRVHAYHDTGFKQVVADGTERPVLRSQSSFGLYVYHEGGVEGWETAIQGATKIAENLYLISVPDKGETKVKVVVQAIEKGDQRPPEEPIRPKEYPRPGQDKDTEMDRKGCLYTLMKLFGFK
jgi:hypothetical protein